MFPRKCLTSFIAFNSCTRRTFTSFSRSRALHIQFPQPTGRNQVIFACPFVKPSRLTRYSSGYFTLLPHVVPPKRILMTFWVWNQTPALQKSRKHTLRCVHLSRLVEYVSLTFFNVQLARKYHPDSNPDKNAREKFVEIQGAYDVWHLIRAFSARHWRLTCFISDS